MRIGYIAEKQLYVWEDGKTTALSSIRYQNYLATMQSIHDAKSWKTSGTGAMFTGAVDNAPVDPARIHMGLHGLVPDPAGMLYAVELDEVGGLYRRDLDPAAKAEGHVLTRQNLHFGGTGCWITPCCRMDALSAPTAHMYSCWRGNSKQSWQKPSWHMN